MDIRNLVEKISVCFMGQDDKGKGTTIGHSVAISSKVKTKSKYIVPVNSTGLTNLNRAADHDWSTANIIPSVTFCCNVPDSHMMGHFTVVDQMGMGN